MNILYADLVKAPKQILPIVRPIPSAILVFENLTSATSIGCFSSEDLRSGITKNYYKLSS